MKPSYRPLVSIVVPVFNVGGYLSRCVQSLATQTFSNIEVVLVDDGSTDDSAELCDEWAQCDNRIQTIHKPNGGLSSARNTGIEASHGDWLMFVDADDYVEPDMIEDLVMCASQSGADLVMTGLRYVDEGGGFLKDVCIPRTVLDEESFWDLMYPTNAGSSFYAACVVACSKLYRRSLFDVERFDEGRVHEDEYILHRIVCQCNRIATTGEVHYNYVQRSNSITNRPRSAGQLLDGADALQLRGAYLSIVSLYNASLKAALGCTKQLSMAQMKFMESGQQLRWDEIANRARNTLNSLDMKDLTVKARLKVFLFTTSPTLYCRLLTLKMRISDFANHEARLHG